MPLITASDLETKAQGSPVIFLGKCVMMIDFIYSLYMQNNLSVNYLVFYNNVEHTSFT